MIQVYLMISNLLNLIIFTYFIAQLRTIAFRLLWFCKMNKFRNDRKMKMYFYGISKKIKQI